jgi:hypothetical protein
MSKILDEVIVTSSKKAKKDSDKKENEGAGAALSSFMTAFNHTPAQVAQWDIDRYNYDNGSYSSLTASQIAMFERRDKSEADWRALNYAILDGATFFVPAPKLGMFRWLKYGGRTFQEAKVAIWAKNAKPIFEPIRDVASGKTFKVFAEIHHRFIPQRWGLPNWITNSRFNLQITNSIEHGLMDPYRAQFFPSWIKEAIKEGTISSESVIMK